MTEMMQRTIEKLQKALNEVTAERDEARRALETYQQESVPAVLNAAKATVDELEAVKAANAQMEGKFLKARETVKILVDALERPHWQEGLNEYEARSYALDRMSEWDQEDEYEARELLEAEDGL